MTVPPTLGEDVANCLRVDFATAEAVRALHDAGVDAVLLKGPVIARWLYPDDPSRRTYRDTDLLVDPDALDSAEAVLDALGYAPIAQPGLVLRHGLAPHARCWLRERDRAAIDLHTAIHGTEHIDPRRVWAAATTGGEPIEVLDTAVDAPGEPFRLVHLVLHVRPWEGAGARSWTDVERAVLSVDADRWRRALALARSLEVDDVFGPLLRLVAGSELADRIGAPERWPLHLRIAHADASSPALFASQLLRLGWPDRVRVVGQWLTFPVGGRPSERPTGAVGWGRLTVGRSVHAVAQLVHLGRIGLRRRRRVLE